MLLRLLSFLAAVFLMACSGGSNSSGSLDVDGGNVVVTPSSDTVFRGSVRTVYSNITGESSTVPTWSASCGTLDTSNSGYAIWTAPATTGTCTVTAISAGGTSASSTFTVIADSVKTANIPAQITLFKNQPQIIQSIIWGTTNTAVTWSTSGGTLRGSGREVVFTASTAGTYTVTATSQADSSKSATTTLVVTNNDYPAAARPNKTEPIDCTATGSGTTYNITSMTNFDSVPWSSLGAGDTVRIHNNGTPYYKQILIRTSGTTSQPIRICGVPDANGNLPEINGANATAYSAGDYGSGSGNLQPLGGIVVYNRTAGYYGNGSTHPHDIIIEGLKITGFNENNTYLDNSTDTTAHYSNFAASIRVQHGHNITLRGNDISYCSNGLFTMSNYGTEVQASRNVLVQGNRLHDNGTVNNYSMHQSYLQSFGLVVQGNYYDTPLSGMIGSQLKTRSVQQFIRYNYLKSAARIFDLVEIQDDGAFVYPWLGLESGQLPYTSTTDIVGHYEAWQNHYVYGNIVNNTASNAAGWIIHGTADMLASDKNPGGVLNFYHNTIDTKAGWGEGIFDFGPHQYTVTSRSVWPTAHAQNNAINITSTSGSYAPWFFWNRYQSDRVKLGKNWLTSNWGTGNSAGGGGSGIAGSNNVPASGYVWQYGRLQTQVSGISNLITTATNQFNTTTYAPVTSGALVGSAAALTGLAAKLPPLMQYNPTTYLMSSRTSVADIGALGVPR